MWKSGYIQSLAMLVRSQKSAWGPISKPREKEGAGGASSLHTISGLPAEGRVLCHSQLLGLFQRSAALHAVIHSACGWQPCSNGALCGQAKHPMSAPDITHNTQTYVFRLSSQQCAVFPYTQYKMIKIPTHYWLTLMTSRHLCVQWFFRTIKMN